MNEVTSSILDARAAGAYARAGGLVPPGPVRPADPVRPRFPALDGGHTAPAPDTAPPPAAAASADAVARTASLDTGAERRRPGLLGALTGFLARVLGQEAETQSRPVMSTGLRAYGRAAAPAVEPGVEVIPPGLPRLSSGRALDLTV